MRLNARTVSRVSTVPASGRSSTASPRPRRPAACARPRIGLASRRPMKTATAAMPSAESRKTARNAAPQAGAPGGGPTATFSQRPSSSATDAVNQSGSRWSGSSSSWFRS